jgi:hypothetical protein
MDSAMGSIPIPPSFMCPISMKIMEDPVVDPDGNTYERTAIESWLQRSSTSPITRAHLTASMLHPNRALRDAIESFHQMTGDAAATRAGQATTPPQVLRPEDLNPDIPQDLIEMSAQQFRMPGGGIGVELCIEPRESSKALPMDIVAVVDISGSMDDPAMVEQGGQQVDVGFSVLDITKHALKTVIEALGPADRLSIVSFSNSAKVETNMLHMTHDNKRRAKNVVDSLRPGGSTNLWDAMRVALIEVPSFFL